MAAGQIPSATSDRHAAPSIRRRIASIPYEGLLLLALLLIAAFPAAGLKGLPQQGVTRLIFQFYLFCVAAAYFVWFWAHGGQTLPMKTWHFRVVTTMGEHLSLVHALARFGATLLFFGPACVGLVLIFFPNRISPTLSVLTFVPLLATLLWARFDVDRQFLHDRIARTKLIVTA